MEIPLPLETEPQKSEQNIFFDQKIRTEKKETPKFQQVEK